MSEKVLEGVRVLEFATYVAGPTCARILGDWGADVIKIESHKGDAVRMLGMNLMSPIDDEENPVYFTINANKRAITLNHRTGKAIIKKLLDSTDVFIINFRGEALEAMGLDYKTLKEKYPRLVYAHVLGFGAEGPDATRPAFDFTTYFARSGFMHAMADPGGAPTVNAPGFGDNQLAMFLAAGISAALFKREKAGKGDYVNVSLYHCGIFDFSLTMAGEQYATMYPYSRTHPLSPLVNTYKCSDGKWYYLGSPDYITYFERSVRALGLEDMADNEDYNNIMGMLMNAEEIVQKFEAVFIQKPSHEWKEIFDRANVPGEIVCTWQDVLNDEQAYANTFLKKMTYANGSTGVLVTTPVRYDSMEINDYNRLPGSIGSDTVEILEELGISREEAQKLKEAKIVTFGE